jgi:glycosyltransferase involved in cell wall biosynthesis
MGGMVRALFTLTSGYVRRWDLEAAKRVTYFVANSHYVSERIRRVYGRESVVIPPPIDLTLARTSSGEKKHYLCAGRLVGYKQTELMMRACERLGRSLRIAGSGPDEARLRRIAGPGTVFLGKLSDAALWQEYAACRALLFAADEDFGMVPLEAQACGRPVIAYGAGGSLETVSAETGLFFQAQTVDSIADGICRFEAEEERFVPEAAQAWAANFATPVFLNRMRAFLLEHVPAAASAMTES